jgi:hypothetical protein
VYRELAGVVKHIIGMGGRWGIGGFGGCTGGVGW